MALCPLPPFLPQAPPLITEQSFKTIPTFEEQLFQDYDTCIEIIIIEHHASIDFQ